MKLSRLSLLSRDGRPVSFKVSHPTQGVVLVESWDGEHLAVIVQGDSTMVATVDQAGSDAHVHTIPYKGDTLGQVISLVDAIYMSQGLVGILDGRLSRSSASRLRRAVLKYLTV
jgi:hypothetical protein